MNRWPPVAVVVPTRDRPALLRRALAAIRAQDYPGRLYVVVVFDGGDPDPDLVSEGDRPVLVLRNWRTAGLAGARNTGILAAEAELVAFADDDDVWAPGKLRSQVAALAGRPVPNWPPARSRSSTRGG